MQKGTSRTRASVWASSVLPRAGRAHQQHVGLLELDFVDLVAGVDPLVVVVDGDRQDLLGAFLADHVLVERVLDLARVGELGRVRLGARRLEHLLFDDLLAEVDALVADVDALARDELADLLLALAAEAAAIGNLGPLAAAVVDAIDAYPVPSVLDRHRGVARAALLGSFGAARFVGQPRRRALGLSCISDWSRWRTPRR